mgnify:CR=1 FL=1
MIPAERQERIQAYLEQNEVGRIQTMVDELGISLSTLRRDLRDMAERGEVQLLRGGAIRLHSANIELNLDAKMLMNYAEKERIARYAATLVVDGDVLFLDPSSANSLLIDFLGDKNVTVVTNSIAHINKLTKLGLSCILIGGQIKRATSSCIGPVAEQALHDLFFNHCFLGANGMSVKQGLTNHDMRERNIKRIAIANAAKVTFLIDSSKFDQIAMCRVAEIGEYPIITDRQNEEYDGFDNIIVAP